MKRRLLVPLVLLCLLFSACTGEGDVQKEAATEKPKVTLTYVEWVAEVASTNVIRVVLEELGYDVKILPVSAAAMWQALATGDADGMTSAWLPTTHGHYFDAVSEKIEDLGPNLVGTRIGLVVPTYVDIDTVGEMATHVEKFDGKIIGVDPGAGIMSLTEKAIETYKLDGMRLMEGSGATMTAALADALKNREWVVVTGWTPHWKFARWDLKYLQDPEKIYGGEETINTIVRKGLKDEMPQVYSVLDRFNWTPAQCEELIARNQEEGADPYKNAKRWVKENRSLVEKWIAD